MDEGFAYSDLAILRHSRRHAKEPASPGQWTERLHVSHWLSRTTCFAEMFWQDWANINLGSPPSCGVPFWQWPVASPSEMFGWQVKYLDIYLFYVYGINQLPSSIHGPGQK